MVIRDFFFWWFHMNFSSLGKWDVNFHADGNGPLIGLGRVIIFIALGLLILEHEIWCSSVSANVFLNLFLQRFYYRHLLSPYLGLFVDISLCVRLLWIGVCLWYLFQQVNCWHIEKLLIFISLFCILPPCWNCWSFIEDAFLWNFWNIISSANWDSFTSFPISTPLLSFSCLIAPALCFRYCIEEEWRCGQRCLIPDLNGIALNSPPLGCWVWVCHI